MFGIEPASALAFVIGGLALLPLLVWLDRRAQARYLEDLAAYQDELRQQRLALGAAARRIISHPTDPTGSMD